MDFNDIIMKKKKFKICAYISAVLFFGFIGLCVYVLIFNPNADNWSSVSIGHGKVSIVHPAMPDSTKFWEDGGGSFHVSIVKDIAEMSGGHLVFFNQNIPFQGVRIFAFANGDKRIGENAFIGYGMEFGSLSHSTNMVGCSPNDQTSEAAFIGYGILFFDLSHSVDKDKNWCTFMISLWYPIIIFGILPVIFVVKKLRGRKLDQSEPDCQ